VRAADALLYCLPAEREGFDEGLLVAEEVRSAGIRLPAAVLVTKADLPAADAFVARAASAFPGLPIGVTALGADRTAVADLIWRLLGLIRVWPAPKGRRDADPVVLPQGATIQEFIEKLDGRWLTRLKRARVTGPSAQFAAQEAGLSHVLADGDEVDLALRA
jgi:ribosome-interacting GTPase 1